MGMRSNYLAAILAGPSGPSGTVVPRAARTFSGADNALSGVGSDNTFTNNVAPGAANSGKRRSHPVPLVLQNGNVLVLYCTNEANANFEMRCITSTDGGLTFGSSVWIGGGGGVDSYEGCAVQLSGGNVVAVYHEAAALRYKISTDNGATWSGATTIAVNGNAADTHPSICLDGSTLNVIYADISGAINLLQATVTSSAVGSFGSAITVASAAALYDPCIAKVSSGVLVCAYQSDAAVFVRRSTNGGASWSSAQTLNTITGIITDANLLVVGSELWVFYAFGASIPNRNGFLRVSKDGGQTWAREVAFGLYSGADIHRINGCMYGGAPLFFSAGIGSDTDYHLDRMTLGPLFRTTASAQGITNAIDNLSAWTSFAWIKYAGTPNAGKNMFVLSRRANDRVFIQIKDEDGTYTNGLVGYVERSTTPSNYGVNNAFADNTWTFVAVNFDDARGTGQRFKFYAGTTPGNLALLTASVVTEGSGAIANDSSGSLQFSGRSSDALRYYPGDIGGPAGVVQGSLTLSNLQQIMAGSLPTGLQGAVFGMGSAHTDMLTGQSSGVYIGTTAAGSTPP